MFVTGASVVWLMDKSGQSVWIEGGEAFTGRTGEAAEEPVLWADTYSSLRNTGQAHNSWWGETVLMPWEQRCCLVCNPGRRRVKAEM